ncbi:peptidyl-tRNA hydrolase Pth2 [Candidatus Pacearchaeota archaeon]|nr:peptidyl-tRNA hydrolase Pth2 [Candidatus Pacearchaeota archaeon]
MIKQVIVVRKDLNMRKGKLAAQVAHAAMAILFNHGRPITNYWIENWLNTGMTKIVVSVDSEDELFAVHEKAKEATILTALIQDEGRTEFKEPTHTAVSVGPCESTRIDEITGNLKLL